MTTKSKPITYHKHLALIRARSDQDFLEALTKLEDADYHVAQIGKDVRFQGAGIIALMQKMPPEPVFEIEDVPEPIDARPELPYDPAIT